MKIQTKNFTKNDNCLVLNQEVKSKFQFRFYGFPEDQDYQTQKIIANDTIPYIINKYYINEVENCKIHVSFPTEVTKGAPIVAIHIDLGDLTLQEALIMNLDTKEVFVIYES